MSKNPARYVKCAAGILATGFLGGTAARVATANDRILDTTGLLANLLVALGTLALAYVTYRLAVTAESDVSETTRMVTQIEQQVAQQRDQNRLIGRQLSIAIEPIAVALDGDNIAFGPDEAFGQHLVVRVKNAGNGPALNVRGEDLRFGESPPNHDWTCRPVPLISAGAEDDVIFHGPFAAHTLADFEQVTFTLRCSSRAGKGSSADVCINTSDMTVTNRFATVITASDRPRF